MASKQFPHYWICNACATERGATWPSDHAATMAAKTCKYCDGKKQTEKYIAPYVDYNWPGMDFIGMRD